MKMFGYCYSGLMLKVLMKLNKKVRGVFHSCLLQHHTDYVLFLSVY